MALQKARYCILGVPSHVTPRDIGEHFSRKYGPVVHASIDKGTAYVTMDSEESREAIVTEKHNIGGKSLRACISKESLHTADAKKVHLGNLPERANPGHVRQAFSKFGVVLDVHLPKDPRTGQRRNYGFVTFSGDDAFEAAIEEGIVLVDGSEVTVKAASQTTGEGMTLAARKRLGIKYFVPRCPDNVTDEELMQHFSKYGEVVEAGVALDRETGRPRGFAYVTFEDASSQEDLLNSDHMLGGEVCQLLLTKEALARYGVHKIHLSNVPIQIPAEEIKTEFASFGVVLDVHTPKNHRDGKRQNYAFVTFATADAFNAAVAAKRLKIGVDEVKIKPAAESSTYEEESFVGRDPAEPPAYEPRGSVWGPPPVEAYEPPEPRGAAAARSRPMSLKERKEAGIKYYVPGLPPSVTDAELEDHFAAFGEVVDAGVVTEKDSGASRGFGYVTMADTSPRAQEALLTATHELGGKAVELMVTKESLAKHGFKVHLGEVDHRITAEALKHHFSHFGLVVDVHTPKDAKTGERKNFCFVTFASQNAFRSALSVKTITIEGCKIKIKPAADSEGHVLEDAAPPPMDHHRRHGGKGPGPNGDGWERAERPRESYESTWGGKPDADREFWEWWIAKGVAYLKGKRGGKGAPAWDDYEHGEYGRPREEDRNYGPYRGERRDPHGHHPYGYDRAPDGRSGKGPPPRARADEGYRGYPPARGDREPPRREAPQAARGSLGSRGKGPGSGHGKPARPGPY